MVVNSVTQEKKRLKLLSTSLNHMTQFCTGSTKNAQYVWWHIENKWTKLLLYHVMRDITFMCAVFKLGPLKAIFALCAKESSS